MLIFESVLFWVNRPRAPEGAVADYVHYQAAVSVAALFAELLI